MEEIAKNEACIESANQQSVDSEYDTLAKSCLNQLCMTSGSGGWYLPTQGDGWANQSNVGQSTHGAGMLWPLPQQSSGADIGFAYGNSAYQPTMVSPKEGLGICDTTMVALGGAIAITEKQSELLRLWDEASSEEEFRISADAMFGSISCDDFVVIAEHALNTIKNTRIYEATGTLSERIFDIVSNGSMFDEHLNNQSLYRHFYTELTRSVNNGVSAIIEKFIETCAAKMQKISVAA